MRPWRSADRGVLRPRQDDHRQVEHAGVQQAFQAGGLITRRAVLRSAYAQFVYLVGGADHDQMEKMRQFMSQLVRRLGRRDGRARSSPRPCTTSSTRSCTTRPCR